MLYVGSLCMPNVVFAQQKEMSKKQKNQQEAASIGLKQLCPKKQVIFSKYWKRTF